MNLVFVMLAAFLYVQKLGRVDYGRMATGRMLGILQNSPSCAKLVGSQCLTALAL